MTEAQKLALEIRVKRLLKSIEELAKSEPQLAKVFTCRLYNALQKCLGSTKRAYIGKVVDVEKGLVEVIE